MVRLEKSLLLQHFSTILSVLHHQPASLCVPLISRFQDEFFSFLASVDASAIRIVSLPEGYVAFPRVPLLRVEGPLLVSV